MIKTKITNDIVTIISDFKPYFKTPLLFLNSQIINEKEAKEICFAYQNALIKIVKYTKLLRSNSAEKFYILYCSHKEKCKQLKGKVVRFLQLENDNHDIELRYFIQKQDHGDFQINWKFNELCKDHLEAIFFEKLASTWNIIKYSDEWASKV